MLNREDIDALVDGLHREVARRLCERGWTLVEGRSRGRPAVGVFTFPLDAGFSAITIFPWQPDPGTGLLVVGRLGVGYEPAARMLAAFIGSGASGVVLNEPTISATVSGVGEVSSAAEQLIDFAFSDAVRLAQGYADIDALVGALRDGLAVPFTGEAAPMYASQVTRPGSTLPLEDVQAELALALLATGGWHDRARRALANHIVHSGEEVIRREYERFVRQLTRWLDADGELSLPTTPPQWPLSVSLQPTRVGLVTAEQEAFGKTRSLMGTLTEPGDNDPGRGGLIHEILEGPNQSSKRPAWLKPPERAAYPIRRVGRSRAAVELDPTAQSWLDRVMQNSSRGSRRTIGVEVWLSWDQELPAFDSHLCVYIGAEPVGVLSPDAAERFRPAMEAAAERDEDPWTTANLTTSTGAMPYVLEITVPERHAS